MTLQEDLAAEQEALATLLDGADADAWATPSPSPGWTVADQLAHLLFFDVRFTEAVSDPRAFLTELGRSRSMGRDAYRLDALVQGHRLADGDLLGAWRASRPALLAAVASAAPAVRVPWYGPSMGLRTAVTARLMEAWAHGQDVVDALSLTREPTPRLRHVAFLGVRSRANGYVVRGLDVPDAPVRVELRAPDGQRWAWGPEDCDDRVVGPAEDFCLVVTRRRHPTDVGLSVVGPAAVSWMAVAQAYAGVPGVDRQPGQFARAAR